MRRRSAQNPPQPPLSPLSRHRLDLVAFARERLHFHPDPDQVAALDATTRRGMLNCCRQWGKSSVVSIRAVHQAFHFERSLTIVAAPSRRQSGEFILKAAALLRELDIRPQGDGGPDHSLLLPNGSRIVGLPGKDTTIRGYSNVSLLLIDEAGYVPTRLYEALRPMTATNPRASIWLLSTPNGRQGFFYEEWIRPDSSWTRILRPATECPRIAPDFLAEERRHHSDEAFRQEYLCEFLLADTAYFNPESVDAAFRPYPGNEDAA